MKLFSQPQWKMLATALALPVSSTWTSKGAFQETAGGLCPCSGPTAVTKVPAGAVGRAAVSVQREPKGISIWGWCEFNRSAPHRGWVQLSIWPWSRRWLLSWWWEVWSSRLFSLPSCRKLRCHSHHLPAAHPSSGSHICLTASLLSSSELARGKDARELGVAWHLPGALPGLPLSDTRIRPWESTQDWNACCQPARRPGYNIAGRRCLLSPPL